MTPYIKTIDEDDADEDLWKIYDNVQRSRGRLSNVLRIQSLHPKALLRHLEMYMEIMYGKAGLGRLERELIAVVVSRANDCDYCVIHHKDALARYTKDAAWVEQVGKDFREATLTEKQQALCQFAVGLTASPADGREAAVDELRKAGFDDAGILHATEIVCYFNFVNRMVLGLGVELEDDPHQDFLY